MAKRRRKRNGTSGLGQAGRRCARFKRVPSKFGGTVRRCARFSGAPRRGLSGLISRCVRYQRLSDGTIRCAQFGPAEPDEVMPDASARRAIYRDVNEEPPPLTEEGVVIKSGKRIRRRAQRQEGSAAAVRPRRRRLPATLPSRLRPRVRRAAG